MVLQALIIGGGAEGGASMVLQALVIGGGAEGVLQALVIGGGAEGMPAWYCRPWFLGEGLGGGAAGPGF